jgi:hypothetical protein
VSGFTEDQKLEFRCEVLIIIRRMRIHQQNTSHINLPPQQRYTGYSTYQSPHKSCLFSNTSLFKLFAPNSISPMFYMNTRTATTSSSCPIVPNTQPLSVFPTLVHWSHISVIPL